MRTNTARTVRRGQRSDDMRRANASAVIRQILLTPESTRSQIARSLGLSPATATNLSGVLVDSGLVRELEAHSGALGRPGVPLVIDDTRSGVLGIHLGPRTSGVAIVGLDGLERASVLVPHADLPAAEAVAKVATAAEEFVDAHRNDVTLLGTGVASGGIVDRQTSTIVENPNAGWRTVDVGAHFAGRLPGPVIVEHNARAAAQSELLYGYGRRAESFVLMVITVDVGSVSVHGGLIRAGFRQAAGNIAHLRVTDEPIECECGRTGCLKVAASDDAVVRRAVAAGYREIGSCEDVIGLAQAGDDTALEILRSRSRRVGRAAAELVDIIDPEYLVVAGTLAENPAHVDDVRAEIGKFSAAGDDAGERVVTSSSSEMSLTVFAAAPVVAAVLADPLGFAGTFADDGTDGGL